MCGIFGAVVASDSSLRSRSAVVATLERLFRLSESRGKEAAGIAFATDSTLLVAKAPTPASIFIKSQSYRTTVDDAVLGHAPLAFIGHSRLVTDGGRELNLNNQPVVGSGVVGIHNGIVVNHADLWRGHPDLQRHFEVDSEVIFALLRDRLSRGDEIEQAVSTTFAELEGAASTAALFVDRDELLLATNNGSLYYRLSDDGTAFAFASESYILSQFAERGELAKAFSRTPIVHLAARTGAWVSISDLSLHRFDFAKPNGTAARKRPAPRLLSDRSASDDASAIQRVPQKPDWARIESRFAHRPIGDRVRRCTKCVLPHTMPFIRFDEHGVCSYCRNYKQAAPLGQERLERLVAPYRRSDGRPDCVVGLSGGRDSTFGLHYIKTVLGMNPVAFTYDWGMVTDLARRNISRICGKLGIEHILVSADIVEKRRFIRQNVEAWLERPSLGTIPLFMAGDKAYFHYLHKVSQDTEAPLTFLCENLLERTDFKSGFAGVPPAFHDENHVYTMSVLNKGRLLGYYGNQFLQNPKYLNSSILDTARAFSYYYLTDRRYHNLYRYVAWREEEVERVLLNELDFERAEDTQSLWRIGDGTAAFYNYIYYTVGGFSENDTFRSNQIREGAIDRATALERITRENRPRWATIQWYLETIGLTRSLESVLEIIERIPKLYD